MNKPKIEIVKIQISLATSDGLARILIYNENGSIQQEELATRQFIDLMDNEPKKYFYASFSKKGLLTILEEAPWQEW